MFLPPPLARLIPLLSPVATTQHNMSQVEQCVSPAAAQTIKIRGVPFAATPEDLNQYFGGLFGEGAWVSVVRLCVGACEGAWVSVVRLCVGACGYICGRGRRRLGLSHRRIWFGLDACLSVCL